jgi:hypothetical protein
MNIQQIPAEPTSLQFRVRAGLIVMKTRTVVRQEGPVKAREQIPQRFEGGSLVELLPSEVAGYAHALEPTDEATRAVLEGFHMKPALAQPQQAGPSEFERTVATTVAAVLAILRDHPDTLGTDFLKGARRR